MAAAEVSTPWLPMRRASCFFGLVVIGWCADRFNLKRRIMVFRITTSHADNVATEVQQLLAEMKVAQRHFRNSMVGLNSIVEFEADVKSQPTGENCRPAQPERYRYRSDSLRGPSRMTGNNGTPRKPKALAAGSRLECSLLRLPRVRRNDPLGLQN